MSDVRHPFDARVRRCVPRREKRAERVALLRLGVRSGKRLATPLLLALLAIEATDILFAVDSIAAVLAISNSPFIVFSSNVFAVLGLRALYILLAELVSNLRYLHYGLGGILVFVGAKMLAATIIVLPHWASLLVTVAILAGAVLPSLVSRRRRLGEV